MRFSVRFAPVVFLKMSNNLFFNFFKDFRKRQILSYQPWKLSVRARDYGDCHRDQYCITRFFSQCQMRKSSFTLDFDMMSDDPWIMRQDPLTRPPLCPSTAPKLCPIWSVLIHRLSAAVCFGRSASDRAGRKRTRWSVWGETSGSTSVKRTLKRRGDNVRSGLIGKRKTGVAVQ